MKTCIKCGIEKPLAEYSRARPDKPYLKRSCKACEAAGGHARYMEHRDEWLAWQKRYVASRPEANRLMHRQAHERRMQDPEWAERHRAYNREWGQANKEKRSANQRRRLGRIATAMISDFTQQQWNGLVVAYGGRCAYCSTDRLKLQSDHVIPLCHGGDHTVRNIVPACGPCNAKKRQHTGVGYPFLIIPSRFVT